MRNAQRLILIACMTSALAADRVAASAPSVRPVVLQTARQLAGRLVISFRRTVPAVRMQRARCDEVGPQTAAVDFAPVVAQAHPCDFSPEQYRLPPPAL